jgi:hypothetical protein
MSSDGGPVSEMSLRDWFAGQALVGVSFDLDINTRKCAAEWAYAIGQHMVDEKRRRDHENLKKRRKNSCVV